MAIEFVSEWKEIALAAVTLSLLIVGGAYAVGSIFDSERLRGWAKTEFTQVIASGIIVAGLLVFATTLETFSFTIAGQDHITYAQNYLTDLNGKLEQFYVGLVAFNTVLITLAKIQIQASAIVVGGSIQPFIGLEAVSHNVEVAMLTVFVSILVNALQINFLVFIKSTMMYFFLPAGVILRSFNPTRSAGALLMALAIGLYFAFPLTYVLANESVAKMNQDILGSITEMESYQNTVKIFENNLLDLDALKNFVVGLPANVWNLAGGITGKILQVAIADLFMQILVLPAIGFAVTFVFIRQLARMLGSYVDIGAWWLIK